MVTGVMDMIKGSVLAFGLLIAITGAVQAQSWGRGGGYAGSSPNQGYYRGSGVHWCTWSAATVCAKWRQNGGRYDGSVCPPGNMSTSCQRQRREEAFNKRK
jgi:hypothetical protein